MEALSPKICIFIIHINPICTSPSEFIMSFLINAGKIYIEAFIRIRIFFVNNELNIIHVCLRFTQKRISFFNIIRIYKIWLKQNFRCMDFSKSVKFAA